MKYLKGIIEQAEKTTFSIKHFYKNCAGECGRKRNKGTENAWRIIGILNLAFMQCF